MQFGTEQIADYHDRGYLIVDKFLSVEECDSLITDAEDVVGGRYANLLNLHLKKESFHNLLINKGILGMADQIHEARMIPIGSIFFFCKPGNELEQGSNLHQDNYAAKAPVGSYMAVGVALDDADDSNGALVVYPGTHKSGDLENKPSKNFDKDENGNVVKAYPIGNEVKVPDGCLPLQLKYSKGSLIFIHGHIIHGAPKNPSETKWRRKMYLHYIKDGDPFWPGWNARRSLIDRDKPFYNKI